MAGFVQAHLLVIDNALLAQISQKGMGAALEPSEDGEEPSFSLTAFLLSFWLSGEDSTMISMRQALCAFSFHLGWKPACLS